MENETTYPIIENPVTKIRQYLASPNGKRFMKIAFIALAVVFIAMDNAFAMAILLLMRLLHGVFTVYKDVAFFLNGLTWFVMTPGR